MGLDRQYSSFSSNFFRRFTKFLHLSWKSRSEILQVYLSLFLSQSPIGTISPGGLRGRSPPQDVDPLSTILGRRRWGQQKSCFESAETRTTGIGDYCYKVILWITVIADFQIPTDLLGNLILGKINLRFFNGPGVYLSQKLARYAWRPINRLAFAKTTYFVSKPVKVKIDNIKLILVQFILSLIVDQKLLHFGYYSGKT